jgi:hypothetical protein
MEPPTDEQAPAPQTAKVDSTAQPATPAEPLPAGTAPPVQAEASPAPSPQIPPPPPNLLLYTVLGFFCIGISLWLAFSWTSYRNRYAQQVEGWQLGATKMVELTLIREDKNNLACASDQSFDGIHCGFHATHEPWGPGPEYDVQALQPYNTVKSELFLASGLWVSPALQRELPETRFTVVCNYHVKGVLRSVSLRWSATGNFSPVDQSLPVGALTDCVIPQ